MQNTTITFFPLLDPGQTYSSEHSNIISFSMNGSNLGHLYQAYTTRYRRFRIKYIVREIHFPTHRTTFPQLIATHYDADIPRVKTGSTDVGAPLNNPMYYAAYYDPQWIDGTAGLSFDTMIQRGAKVKKLGGYLKTIFHPVASMQLRDATNGNDWVNRANVSNKRWIPINDGITNNSMSFYGMHEAWHTNNYQGPNVASPATYSMPIDVFWTYCIEFKDFNYDLLENGDIVDEPWDGVVGNPTEPTMPDPPTPPVAAKTAEVKV